MSICSSADKTSAYSLRHVSPPFQGKLKEAGPLYVRATEVWEKALGPDHPLLATVLANRAALSRAQVRGVGGFEEVLCPDDVVFLSVRQRAVWMNEQPMEVQGNTFLWFIGVAGA